jgi:Fic family protein
MLGLLIKAEKQIAVLENLAKRIPDIQLFVSMYVRKEALMSSQIEGTQATLEDILDPSLEANTNRDIAEVVNYIKATNYAINRLSSLPLSNRLIKETHQVLMDGTRGQEKSPGFFRTSQNWIGGFGSTLKTASYIPPNVQDMEQAMSDLEKYLHAPNGLNVLIRAALIHYQFETIHPFLDGNGRIGRLLITLYLMANEIVTTPALYLSYYIKQNRIEYYDRMSEVRNKGNYEQWVNFFLKAIYESGTDAIKTMDRLLALYEQNLKKISQLGRANKNAMQLFMYLQSNPIIETQKTAQALNIAFNTASSAINRLVGLGILRKNNDQSRNRIFVYTDYLQILKTGTE